MGGFDVIDQFQPAALRYQLNHMGFRCWRRTRRLFAEPVTICRAQRNLIDKYLLKKVWGWVFTNPAGASSTSPAIKSCRP